MKAIGFLGGQFGDSIISIGLQKVFTQLHPEVEFTFALSKKYSAILPLFNEQSHIKSIHAWEGYDNLWPTQTDREFINEQRFDYLFNPMQAHRDNTWYLRRHQVAEVCHMYGFPEPETNEVTLNRYFTPYNRRDTVALALFPNNGQGVKSMNVERANFIANYLHKQGIKTIQLGTSAEPKIENCPRLDTPYFDSVRHLTGCRFVIAGDTGLSWVASAYKIPILGLYAYGYYHGVETSKNWQPVNPNAEYLEGRSINDIPLEHIAAKIDTLINATQSKSII